MNANAGGHFLAVVASDSDDELWAFVSELSDRLGGEAPGIHGFEPEQEAEGAPRYCLHPTGKPALEVRADTLREVLLKGASALVKSFPDHEMWEREIVAKDEPARDADAVDA